MIETYRKEVLEGASEGITIVLVGAKNDHEQYRQVTLQEGEDLARALGCQFVETSAKNGNGVDEMFNMMVRGVLMN